MRFVDGDYYSLIRHTCTYKKKMGATRRRHANASRGTDGFKGALVEDFLQLGEKALFLLLGVLLGVLLDILLDILFALILGNHM